MESVIAVASVSFLVTMSMIIVSKWEDLKKILEGKAGTLIILIMVFSFGVWKWSDISTFIDKPTPTWFYYLSIFGFFLTIVINSYKEQYATVDAKSKKLGESQDKIDVIVVDTKKRQQTLAVQLGKTTTMAKSLVKAKSALELAIEALASKAELGDVRNELGAVQNDIKILSDKVDVIGHEVSGYSSRFDQLENLIQQLINQG
jgi:peptidoglycan hydrolase CwlO-like protein